VSSKTAAALLIVAVSVGSAPPAGAADTPDAAPPPSTAPAQILHYGRFGDVSVYASGGEPRDVVLFVSGDGGWNLGVISMAQLLSEKGAIVAGIDVRHYLHELEQASEKCVSLAGDFENLSHFVQSRLKLKRYVQPTLVGYSSGATLVYATLAEAPDGLFKGALSLGFCPDLDLKKPVCKGSGIEATPRRDSKGELKGVNFLPAKQLSGKWISLQGEIDQVCPAAMTQKFIAAVPGGEIIMLPNVGHGYSVEKNWVPQFESAYTRITAPSAAMGGAALPAPVADLPLIEVPAVGGATSPWFGVFLSGDAAGSGSTKEFPARLRSSTYRWSGGIRSNISGRRAHRTGPPKISTGSCAITHARGASRTQFSSGTRRAPIPCLSWSIGCRSQRAAWWASRHCSA
jgi:type IV secretory pathway VirJ component